MRCVVVASAVLLTAAAARAVEPIEVGEGFARHWLDGDSLGPFYELPQKGELGFEVTGPGTLLVFVVNHRSVAKRSASTLLVTRDGKPLTRLKLGCVPGKGRFAGAAVILPCTRISRDFTIEAGVHRIGLRLGQSRFGASAHFMFVSQAELDAEPELVTAVSHSSASAEEVSELDPLAGEPELVPIEAASGGEPEGDRAAAALPDNPVIWTLGGGGALAAGAAGFFGWRSRVARSDADAAGTQREVVRYNEAYRSNAIVADALFGAAIVSLGAAALLHFSGWMEAPAAAGSVEGSLGFESAAGGWGVRTCVQF